jgi:hypothetical protein
VVASITRNVEALAAPQPDPASTANILSVGLQSLAIRPRNAPSSPKKPQSPNNQATNIRQQSLASRSLAEQSIPARCKYPLLIKYPKRETTKLLLAIVDDTSQFDNQPPFSAQRSAAELQTIRCKPVSLNLPTPQQLLGISSTKQYLQSSLSSTSNNLNLLDQDDILNDYQDGYTGSAEDTENEGSLDSGVRSKVNATKRQSLPAQRAQSVSRDLYFIKEDISKQ